MCGVKWMEMRIEMFRLFVCSNFRIYFNGRKTDSKQ